MKKIEAAILIGILFLGVVEVVDFQTNLSRAKIPVNEWNNILETGLIKGPDFIVDQKGSEFRVIEGQGSTRPSEANYSEAGAAITAAIGEGGANGTVRYVRVKGPLNVETQIKLKSNLFLEFDVLDFNLLINESAFLIDDGSVAIHNLWLQGKHINNPYIALKNAQQDEDSPQKLSYDIHIDIGLIWHPKFQAILLKYLFGEIWIDYLRTDNFAVPNTEAWNIEIGYIDGLTIGTLKMTQPAFGGFKLHNINSLWADDLFVDSSGNEGSYLEQVANAYINRYVMSLCGSTGAVLRYPKSIHISQFSAHVCGGDGMRIEYTGDYVTDIGVFHANHCGENLVDGAAVRFRDAKYVVIRELSAIDDYVGEEVMKHAIVEENESLVSDHNQVGIINTLGLTSTTIVSSAVHSKYPGWPTIPSAIAVGGSAFSYQNLDQQRQAVIVEGGTVSAIEFSRDNVNWYNVGETAGYYILMPADYLRVTYTVAPNMTKVPL